MNGHDTSRDILKYIDDFKEIKKKFMEKKKLKKLQITENKFTNCENRLRVRDTLKSMKSI